jgi:hypothetical protein
MEAANARSRNRIRFDLSLLDVQRGFLVGVSHKNLEFTSYVFNVGWTDPTVVLEVGVSF